MDEPLRRHDLVAVDAAAWQRCLDGRPDLAEIPGLAAWCERGRPLVVRRFLPDEPRDGIALGLPLPPHLGKRRLGFLMPREAASPRAAPTLADVRAAVPAAWHATLDALAALGMTHGVVPRPFGSALWAALTGLPYLSESSDLDVLWPLPGCVPPALLDGLARVARAAPMRLDGEFVLPDGAGVQWEELRRAGAGDAVLCKSLDRVEMRPAAAILQREAA